MCELTEDNVLMRFKENNPIKSSNAFAFQGLFSILAGKGLITTQAVEILQRIFKQVSLEPRFVRCGNSETQQQLPPPPVDLEFNEMSRVLCLTDEAGPESLQQRLLLALLVYVFNLHNQPQPLPPLSTPPSVLPSANFRCPYLRILSKIALELSCPNDPSDPTSVTEREVTLWTMVAIGSASSFSPWRMEIPFMGHLIEWMEDDEDNIKGTCSTECESEPQDHDTAKIQQRKKGANLEKLTACLRGYYLYGADKQTLRSLQRWKGDDLAI